MLRIISLFIAISILPLYGLRASEAESDTASIKRSWTEVISNWFRRIDTQHMMYVDQISRDPELTVEQKKKLIQAKINAES